MTGIYAGLLVAMATALVILIVGQAIDATITTRLVPAFAETGNSTSAGAEADQKTRELLMGMLNSSESVAKAKMAELQSIPVPITPALAELYSLAEAEKTAAVDSLDRSDLESAKTHTLRAMNLFKQLAELANNVSDGEGALPSTDKDVDTINLRISEIQRMATHLRTIAAANDLIPITGHDFAAFDVAIGSATLAVIQGDLEQAYEQISIARELLDSINEKMRFESYETNQSNRALKFAHDAMQRIEELIAKAEEMGLSDAELASMETDMQDIMNQMEEARDLDYIVQLVDQLIDNEENIRVLIGEPTDEPVDEPAPDEPVGDEPVDEEPAPDEPVDDEQTDDQPNRFDDDLSRLENEIAFLKLKANEAALVFPVSDVDEMLSSIQQHVENGENETAAQDIDQLDEYLATISDVIQSYSETKAEITTATERAESLRAKVTELNYLQFLAGIEDALAMLSDAESALDNVAHEDSLSYSSINSALDQIHIANEMVASANSQLDETRASLDEFLALVEETRAKIEQERERADAIEADIPDIVSPLAADVLDALDAARSLLDSATESLEAGEIDQALEYLNEATSYLDTAEKLLSSLLESLL